MICELCFFHWKINQTQIAKGGNSAPDSRLSLFGFWLMMLLSHESILIKLTDILTFRKFNISIFLFNWQSVRILIIGYICIKIRAPWDGPGFIDKFRLNYYWSPVHLNKFIALNTLREPDWRPAYPGTIQALFLHGKSFRTCLK